MNCVRDSTDAVRELRGVRYNLLRVRITGLLRPAVLLKKGQIQFLGADNTRRTSMFTY
jgi:hypothetical protein